MNCENKLNNDTKIISQHPVNCIEGLEFFFVFKLKSL